MSIALVLHDKRFDDVDVLCTNCGYELISHDQWPEPFCADGCEGLYLNDDGDIVNDNGHPPTCGCPQACNPDYYYDQGR